LLTLALLTLASLTLLPLLALTLFALLLTLLALLTLLTLATVLALLAHLIVQRREAAKKVAGLLRGAIETTALLCLVGRRDGLADTLTNRLEIL
jgi:hypothetical protein